MRRLFLVALFAVGLVVMFTTPQPAKASGQCYWWWKVHGVIHYSYFDCAHPTKPPWEGGPINPSPGTTSHPPTQSPTATPPTTHPPTANPPNGPTYPNHYPWGQCTWWAAQSKLTENLEGLGNAGMWAINARKHGLSVGSTPRVNATVVFAPGVQGAKTTVALTRGVE